MSEINFIPDQNPKKGDKESNSRQDERDITWTKPEADKYKEISGKQTDPPSKAHKDNFAGENNIDRKKETLIKKSDHIARAKEEINGKTGKIGFLSRLKNILKGSKPKKKQDSSFKKNKDLLVDYQEVFNKEKTKRRGMPEQAGMNKSSKIYSTPEAVAAKIIKRKIKIKNVKDVIKLLTSFSRNRLSASNILKTNLIKGDVTAFFDWKKHFKIVFLYIFFAGSIISLLYIGLDYWESSISERGVALINDIEEIIPKIEAAEEKVKKVDSFQKKLNLASLLLDKHIYWTNFFKFLEENTIYDIDYGSEFTGGINGDYTFKSIANSYGMLADQIKVFEQSNLVTEASIKKARLTQSRADPEEGAAKSASVGVGYNLILKIKPEVFYK